MASLRGLIESPKCEAAVAGEKERLPRHCVEGLAVRAEGYIHGTGQEGAAIRLLREEPLCSLVRKEQLNTRWAVRWIRC